jgi:hypothetical protein
MRVSLTNHVYANPCDESSVISLGDDWALFGAGLKSDPLIVPWEDRAQLIALSAVIGNIK